MEELGTRDDGSGAGLVGDIFDGDGALKYPEIRNARANTSIDAGQLAVGAKTIIGETPSGILLPPRHQDSEMPEK
jgi:hypothetical protein